MYTGDVRKQPATYRIPRDLLAAVTVEAAERGETVTDMVIRSMEAYIQRGEAGGITSAPSVAFPSVHTPVEAPADYEEPVEKLEAPPCKHPAEAVEAGECGICHADVW